MPPMIIKIIPTPAIVRVGIPITKQIMAIIIKIVQYIFKVGMLDVDDILLCVAGMMSFYYFYGKYRGKNKKRGM